MSVRNRELSQFGSFIYVDDSTKTVGIATTASPNVGIGTTNAQYKLHVVGNTNLDGNTNVTGVVSATSYYLNGNPLVNAEISSWQTSGSDVYRLSGSVGIGTSVFPDKLTVIGNVRASQFISTETTLAPFQVSSTATVTNLSADLLDGKNSPSGDIVGTTDTQTLTNKTINLTNNTLGGTKSQFDTALSDDNFAFLGTTQTFTAAQTFRTSNAVRVEAASTQDAVVLAGRAGGTSSYAVTIVPTTLGANRTLTLPDATTTLVGTDASQTLTNKTIAAASNTISGLTNANLSGTANISNANLANSTISGISLGSNLATLSFDTYITGTSYNGSTPITIGLNASSTDISGNTVVVRSNGNFSAGDITATNFNSTSDINLKENVQIIENSLELVNNIRGVTFDWKENHKKSYGVIAQELEKVLPELVNSGDIKSVNYNGLIGILIEAVKELSTEVQELKAQLNK